MPEAPRISPAAGHRPRGRRRWLPRWWQGAGPRCRNFPCEKASSSRGGQTLHPPQTACGDGENLHAHSSISTAVLPNSADPVRTGNWLRAHQSGFHINARSVPVEGGWKHSCSWKWQASKAALQNENVFYPYASCFTIKRRPRVL